METKLRSWSVFLCFLVVESPVYKQRRSIRLDSFLVNELIEIELANIQKKCRSNFSIHIITHDCLIISFPFSPKTRPFHIIYSMIWFIMMFLLYYYQRDIFGKYENTQIFIIKRRLLWCWNEQTFTSSVSYLVRKGKACHSVT